ncbi:hypothetical protein Ais01nite_72560 [Asanoa ishikariensis]|uniref:DUF4386 family protein n=1 Tax=Asanoa ishikariensis TaxID=137265 RepID=A0A1H3URS0_9ACTN|nr:hypothetical protein [Asanoa ishikariensis]GIF69221.1 hypothetical protein Ais01nite_72560 [Asanoa ishikariensis]SDZ64595.1 hypothetical protein SAMN05421684_7790 [Asanoa ishikariensis]
MTRQLDTTPPTAPPMTVRSLRRPAWLLVLSPLLFVAWLAALVPVMSATGVTNAADIPPDQLGTVRWGWAIAWPLYAMAVLVGAAAMALINGRLRSTSGRALATASQVAVAGSAITVVGHLALIELAGGFSEPRLGDNDLFAASQVLSYATIWCATVAVVLSGLALRSGGVLRRTGLTIAIVAAVLLLLDVATRGLPPFMVAVFWLVVGIGLLRRRVPSAA